VSPNSSGQAWGGWSWTTLPRVPRVQFLAAATTLGLALALGGCGSNRSVKPASFDGAAYPPGVSAPGFMLEDQQGRRVSLSALRGEVVVLAFVSTNCRACRLAAQQVRGALDELAEAPTYGKGAAVAAMSVLFLSTDPASDTHTAVKRFLAETSLAGRARYLTGPLARLRRVWHAYRTPPMSAGKRESEAATTVLLIGRTGAERDAFGLEQLTPESLAHDIRLLRDGRPTPD
jgi:cytochrome oxidase Cu insertion factor (SCO1/SenC/PrrC family)